MTSIVAIDLETTGLDASKDAIIEIGAVKFNGARGEKQWSTLINPQRPIPSLITQLTGITNEMVRNAPPISAVLQDLESFVGEAPILGHNVQFDLGFLRRQKLFRWNETIDTYDLAAVLMPSASRYNLGSLGQLLGILIPNSHRALDDASLTHAVYVEMLKKAREVPIELLAELVRQGEHVEWDGGWFFKQMLIARSNEPPTSGIDLHDYGNLFVSTGDILLPPLTPADPPIKLDAEEVSAVLEPGGPFQQYFLGYEQRPQQLAMLQAVNDALSKDGHLLVEAGTGTGKSFAYLVPAALWATKNNDRVVVSTNTIALQEQLINKDIPDLRKALDLDLRAVVLKGRSNYLCPRRFEAFRHRDMDTPDEIRLLGKILNWLASGATGDRSEINLNGPVERDIWSKLSADDEGCRAEVCVSRMGGACPFYRSRIAAQSAHLVIVNHALLLSDVVTGSRVLPEYHHLIVDEGHHMEAATTSALSYRLSQTDISRLLREFGGLSSGTLGRLVTAVRDYLKPSELGLLIDVAQKATDRAFRSEQEMNAFLGALDLFLEQERDGQPVSNYGQQTRITNATRTLPTWTEVEMAWDSAHNTLNMLIAHASDIQRSISSYFDEPGEEVQDTLGSFMSVVNGIQEMTEKVNQLVSTPDNDNIYWVEITPNNFRMILQIAPLHVGPLMERHLWHEKSSMILTSATLTTQGEFDYLRSRLNADEADELVLGSPFDFEHSALLYIPNDIPEPMDASAHQRAVDQAIIRLAKTTQGRMLVLFTAYAQLKKTSQNITNPLSEAGIQVFEQGEGASANTLLETFRTTEKAVLLGTRAFWEGVDIPGEALSALVITKLPFDVPSDPIIAARSETFDDPFNEYHLPEAILRFRQGFGRLIRTQSDKGIVVVLDKRVLTKKYGKSFIDSLPTCKTMVASVQDLPAATKRWLNL
ncbi:MAG TPA: helicase C-terminal domain-containing protein [Bellilinea sp.]|nr:helicase C-terminal domain-containing protein [Bellilinea sp.]